MNKDNIFNRLWDDYSTQNPSVKKIHTLFEEAGEVVINDHIAFRTFNDPRISKEVLAKPFLQAGYEVIDYYDFKAKHLKAFHLEHPTDELAPRVFISELLLEEFSVELQNAIHTILEAIPETYYFAEELIFSGRIWSNASYKTYQKLINESEYAAWVYAHGFHANHFTVSVNRLKNLNTLELVNEFLESNGHPLLTAGGVIKGSPEQLLQQSSTLADIIPVDFTDGTHNIPSCFYEFARRFPDGDGKLFSGFIAKSADKIFESTNFKK